MKNLLIINSSARTLHSHSRKLTEVFIDHWKNIHMNSVIRFRDLGETDLPHINEKWISASFKPEALRTEAEMNVLKPSNAYIAELKNADVIVLATPMYNWSIPSSLKAYIDHIMRVNETFKISSTDTKNPYVGLLENKTLFLLLSRGAGGYEEGEHNEHMNFQDTYLKTVFNVMGIGHIHVVAVNGASLDAEELKNSIIASHQSIKVLIEMELV